LNVTPPRPWLGGRAQPPGSKHATEGRCCSHAPAGPGCRCLRLCWPWQQSTCPARWLRRQSATHACCPLAPSSSRCACGAVCVLPCQGGKCGSRRSCRCRMVQPAACLVMAGRGCTSHWQACTLGYCPTSQRPPPCIRPLHQQTSALPAELAASLDACEAAVRGCAAAADAPLVLYVSKMVAVPAAALPRSESFL
jgi:hypothetical protein